MARKPQKRPCRKGCGYLVFGGAQEHDVCPRKGLTGVVGPKTLMEASQPTTQNGRKRTSLVPDTMGADKIGTHVGK